MIELNDYAKMMKINDRAIPKTAEGKNKKKYL